MITRIFIAVHEIPKPLPPEVKKHTEAIGWGERSHEMGLRPFKGRGKILSRALRKLKIYHRNLEE